MVYPKFVLLLIVATWAPFTPGTEERLKGVASFQHWMMVWLSFVTRAGATRKVVLVTDWEKTRGERSEKKARDCKRYIVRVLVLDVEMIGH
jgi:hypothetical protein